MLAYTQGTTKAQVLARVRRHREADRLIHGTYWEDGRGCAVGCTVSGRKRAGETWYDAVARQLGIPAHLAALEDAIFEGLPSGDAQTWPERFLGAIPEEADLSRVWPQFAIWLLTEEAPSASGEAVAALYRRRLAGDEPTDAERSRAAEAARAASAARVAEAALYRRRLAGDEPTDAEWSRAAEAARAARAAWAAGAAEAAEAARAAGAAREAWAAGAAWAAEAAEAAWEASFTRQADKLVELCLAAGLA